MSVTTKLYTAEELWEMPGDEPWELWEGELLKAGGAGWNASELAHWIGSLITMYARPRRLGFVTGADGSYILERGPDTVLVPDVALVRLERQPAGERPKRFAEIVPDVVVEVRSPYDRPGQSGRKLALYQRAGVPLIWWVDPDRRTVTVHRLGQSAVEVQEGEELDGEGIIPGFRVPVSEIFAEP